ncbi:MAG TPA: AMP-binding protein [Baekduia sp.]|nr:AMP-binding protein [Baekduia sp.]
MSDGPGISDHLHLLRVFARCGIVAPARPDKILRAARAVIRWGPTPAGGYGFNTALYPQRIAVIDERGTVTYEEISRRTNAIANGLAELGVEAGDNVAVMCRNHRGWVESTLALSKLGAHALYLNTSFAAPQVKHVCSVERPTAIICDEEFEPLVTGAHGAKRTIRAWSDTAGAVSLESLAAGDDSPRQPPRQKGRFLILTSGTTGAPKGADREQPKSLHPAAALMDRIPLRARQPTLIASPLFHSWGFAQFTVGMALSSTIVLSRTFDAEGTLALIERHKVRHLIVVPVMLQRLLDLPRATVASHDTSSLRVIAASGSALPGELALHVMDRFGDVLYNLYGSTEVAWATVAGPRDLRRAPGTAGRPPRGTTIRLVDASGRDVPDGSPGRIFVVNELQMRGYTEGGNKETLGEYMATGDVGQFDQAGRLFVNGRDDEMIVSGGENVFPREVEDLLVEHEAVAEVAVLGVQDAQFGQRLQAFVVLHEGAAATADELRDYVRTNLAGYKVPREIVFVDALPRNETGKIVKRDLAGLTST